MILHGSAEGGDPIIYHLDNPYRKVALQFPDDLLQYSVPLYRSLRAKVPGKEFFVMADTSFGRYVSRAPLVT